MKNTTWFRHFLICNKIAEECCSNLGYLTGNFAKLIKEEDEGKIANSQMTRFFWAADKVLSDIRLCDNKQIFEMIEEEQDKDLNHIANIPQRHLNMFYKLYVVENVTI